MPCPRAHPSGRFAPPHRRGSGHPARPRPETQPPLRPLHLVVRETEFCGQRLAGDFSRRMRENGRNSVRRPRHASLTDRNCEGFCRPGNRVGLPVLYGGGRSPQEPVCGVEFCRKCQSGCYCFLGGSKRRFSKRSNASVYNALADPEPIRRQQNNSQKQPDNSQRSKTRLNTRLYNGLADPEPIRPSKIRGYRGAIRGSSSG